MIKKLILFMLCCSLLAGVGLVAKPDQALACSCAAPPSVERQVKEQLDRQSAVFAGVVTKVTPPRQKFIRSSADQVGVDLIVTQVWKGELAQKATVYTAMSSASCGYDTFQAGQEYIVAASLDSGRLVTSICSLTQPLKSGNEALQYLGTGTSPSQANPGNAPDSKRSTAAVLIPAIAVIVAGCAFGWLQIRRRRPGR